MNAILQCLLNIETFANDLMFDFNLIKSNTSEIAAKTTDSDHKSDSAAQKQTLSGSLFK